MRRVFTLLLSVVLFATMAMAEDVIYLNNGKIIKGTVTKDDGTTVEVQSNGTTLQYKKLEIRKIDKATSAVVVPETPKRAPYIDYDTQKKGWWCAVEIMGGGTVDVNYDPHFYNIGLSFINGYRFNQFIRIGIGLAFRYYIPAINKDYQVYDKIPGLYEPKNANFEVEDTREGSQYKYHGAPWAIPLFIDIRGNLISNDTRMCVPYWAFDIGYSFSNYAPYGLKGILSEDGNAGMAVTDYNFDNVKKSVGEGFFFAPTLGIKIGMPRNTLLLGITYMGQFLPRWDGSAANDNLTVTSRFTSFMCGKIAYEF